jgi:hypothetical protein
VIVDELLLRTDLFPRKRGARYESMSASRLRACTQLGLFATRSFAAIASCSWRRAEVRAAVEVRRLLQPLDLGSAGRLRAAGQAVERLERDDALPVLEAGQDRRPFGHLREEAADAFAGGRLGDDLTVMRSYFTPGGGLSLERCTVPSASTHL